MSVFPRFVSRSPVLEYEMDDDWQVKSLGYEAAFPLCLELYEAKTGHGFIDRNYRFDIDEAFIKYKSFFILPSKFFFDGIYRGFDMFVQVSCSHKPTQKELSKVKTIILEGLQKAHNLELKEYISQMEEE